MPEVLQYGALRRSREQLMSIAVQGRRSRGLGVLTPDPLKICRRGQSMFDPQNVTFFHSKLFLDNSASFTSGFLTCVKNRR